MDPFHLGLELQSRITALKIKPFFFYQPEEKVLDTLLCLNYVEVIEGYLRDARYAVIISVVTLY